MSTPVFVDPESSTQADGAQSSRVPVPLPEDPHETIRKAYLVSTDTESEPFEDLGNESPESPYVVASPISFPDSTPPVGHVKESEGSGTSSAGSTSSDSTTPLSPDHPLTRDTPVLVPSLSRTPARHGHGVQPCVSTPSPSLTLPVPEAELRLLCLFWLYDSEGDELGDEEVSLDSDSGSEDAEDEGPAAGDEDPSLDDEGYGLDDESRGIDDEGHSVERDGLGLEEEDEVVLEGQQQAALVVETTGFGSAPETERSERVSAFRQPVLTTWTDPEDGTVYIDVPTYPPSAPPVQTSPLPD
ncbi:hypothetical protein Tco_0519299 [Tanacetum coccineum]